MLQVNIEKQLGSFHLKACFEAADEITGILGASGSGKSVTLRCIAGIETPDKGSIVLNGVSLFDSEKKINLSPQKREVGYLFQNYALFPNMTVKKNILCGLKKEKDKEKAESIYEETIAMLRLKTMENKMIGKLSGGEQQRVALARILVNRPRLLMLDEPFSSLDAYLRDKLQIEVKQLLEKYAGPVLMVTHSRNEAYHMCGKLAVINNGSLEKTKATKELFADPGNIRAAEITGCKNIIPAEKSGDHSVYVPEWGVSFITENAVEDNIRAIGIRAHYFSPKSKINRYKIIKTGEVEEPFEWIIRFRYEKQNETSADLWWRIPKDRKPEQMPAEFGISPVNIHLLY